MLKLSKKKDIISVHVTINAWWVYNKECVTTIYSWLMTLDLINQGYICSTFSKYMKLENFLCSDQIYEIWSPLQAG